MVQFQVVNTAAKSPPNQMHNITVGQAYFIFGAGAGAGAFSSKLDIQSPNWSFKLPTMFLELELELLTPRKVLKQEPELSALESVFRARVGAFDFLLYFRL